MQRQYYSQNPNLIALIKEELDKFMIDEVLDSFLETDYDMIKKNIGGFSTIIFRFKTNSGEEYDLDFFFFYY